MPEADDQDFPEISLADVRRVTALLRERIGQRRFIPELAAVIQTTGFSAPFDWIAWLKERGGEDWALARETIANADLGRLRRLLTAHLRINRFVDGHLDSLIESGYFERVRERLEEILASGESES